MSWWSAVTWDVARTGGFVAYVLLAVSISLGLVLSLRWRSSAWPRWATTDLHRYVTLLALVFTGIHTVAVMLDPFMAFTPAEVFVPMLSHYRPIWMALGIVAAYLMVALWLSDRIQKLIGYARWRQLHYLAFGVYALTTVHGIAMGSDTRTPWAIAIYAGSALLIGSLLSTRMLGPAPHITPRPRLAAAVAGLAVITVIWAMLGPLRPGWNTLANNGSGSGARIALAGSRQPASTAAVSLPFRAGIQGTASQLGGFQSDGGIQVDGTLSGGLSGRIQVVLQGQQDPNGGLAIERSQILLLPNGGTTPYQGQVGGVNGGHLIALLHGPTGDQIRLDLALQIDGAGTVSGTVTGSAPNGTSGT